jgi:hypothetical protein
MPLYVLTNQTVSLIVNAGDGPTLLYNRDIVNQMAFGPTSGIGFGPTANQNEYDILDPQASVLVDGDSDVYASVLGSGSLVATLDAMPGVSELSPSPALVAESISALGLALDTTVHATNTMLGTGIALPVGASKDTSVNAPSYGPATHIDVITTSPANTAQQIYNTGVPLQTANTPLQSSSAGVTVPGSGGYYTGAVFTVPQIGYELYLDVRTAGSGIDGLQINIYWTDSASSILIEQQTFFCYPGGNTSGTANQFVIKGPSRANQCQLYFASAAGTDPMTVRYNFLNNSRIYDLDNVSVSQPGIVPGLTGASYNVPANVLCSTGPTVVATGNTSRVLPLYEGSIHICANTASGTTDMQIQIVSTLDPGNSLDQIVFYASSDSHGIIDTYGSLPAEQCQLKLYNHNASGQIVQCFITLQEY